MATHVLIALLSMVSTGAVATEQPDIQAEQIVRMYLGTSYPEEGHADGRRSLRLALLAKLGDVPGAAVEAVGQALPKVSDPRRRAELAEALGQFVQTQAAAALLREMLDDPNDQVRWQAIHGLRKLAARTDRFDGRRVQRASRGWSKLIIEEELRKDFIVNSRPGVLGGMPIVSATFNRPTIEPKDERSRPLEEFAPKVEGLVPYLIEAAGDDVEANRICALYALADSRDPLAVAELRHRLKDPSEKVRFYAACFLTEYQDTSGLDILLEALDRLRAEGSGENPEREFEYFGDVERLVASFERITGKSFGATLMNLGLSSDTRQMPVVAKRYVALLATWAQWWAWRPSTGS